VINGLGGNDRIYAGAGNDTIATGSGNDYVFAGSGSDTVSAGAETDLIFGDNPVGKVYADPSDTGTDGNDVIDGGLGSDSIDGGGANDIILTGGDGSAHPSASITHGGPGNDVILSDFRHPTLTEYFYGDSGSDLLWPNPIRITPLGNTAIGGAGNDVIILLNGLPDGAHMGDLATSVKIPIGEFCSVSVPLPDQRTPGSNGKLSCKLPIDVRIPGLVNGIDLQVSIDSSGKANSDVSVKPSPELGELQAWVDLARGDFPRELCICDPKLPGWASILGDTVYS
jgi:Ca2+-binding RTX toxin-like protein